MIGGGEILVDGVFGADSVGRKISGGGEGVALVLEDQATYELGVELHDDRAGG